jgi:hypothetical protein
MANSDRIDFIVNGSATSSSRNWVGGNGTLYAEGTFSGTSLQLQAQSPNGTWMNVGSAVTAAGLANFTVPDGQLRVTVTGGTPSALFVYAVSNPRA